MCCRKGGFPLQRHIIQSLGILIGSFIFTFGLNNFFIANKLAEGGFVGISLIGLYLLDIPVGYTFLLLNIPLFFVGWKMFGRGFLIRTIAGVVAVSIFAELTVDLIDVRVEDKLLAALYGGVFSGVGLGIIFRCGATTGGADIIARMTNHYLGWSIGRTLFLIDVVVIIASAFIVGRDAAMYSLVALFIAAKVIDMVIEGVSTSRAMTIISDQSKRIAEVIQTELGRGTTLLKGTGGYTGRDKEVLYVVVSRDEIARIHEICRSIDPLSFIVVNDVHDVLGEGFNPLVKTTSQP